MATDSGDRRAFATLTLNVIDENDSIPQFISSNIEISVSVNSRLGESVFMVILLNHSLQI